MNSSVNIASLASALSKAQAEMPTVKFDAKNPFLNNRYATLGAVIEAARPVLAKYALSLTQFPVSQEGRIGVRSILMHESGEYIEDTISVVPEAKGALSINQAAGVSITYLRRYAYTSILGLYAEEDVDGNNDAQQGSGKANEAVEKVMSKREWSFEQMDKVIELMPNAEDVDYKDVAEILAFSALPEDAPVKTIESWFKHYLKSAGNSPIAKAEDANAAYIKAKTGGKK